VGPTTRLSPSIINIVMRYQPDITILFFVSASSTTQKHGSCKRPGEALKYTVTKRLYSITQDRSDRHSCMRCVTVQPDFTNNIQPESHAFSLLTLHSPRPQASTYITDDPQHPLHSTRASLIFNKLKQQGGDPRLCLTRLPLVSPTLLDKNQSQWATKSVSKSCSARLPSAPALQPPPPLRHPEKRIALRQGSKQRRLCSREACAPRPPSLAPCRPVLTKTLVRSDDKVAGMQPLERGRRLRLHVRLRHPGAMEAVRHALRQRHARQRLRRHRARVQHDQLRLAARLVVHVGEQVAVVLACAARRAPLGPRMPGARQPRLLLPPGCS